jgi:hypothetical protein
VISNDAVLDNPYDENIKEIAMAFAELLRGIRENHLPPRPQEPVSAETSQRKSREEGKTH